MRDFGLDWMSLYAVGFDWMSLGGIGFDGLGVDGVGLDRVRAWVGLDWIAFDYRFMSLG